MTASRIEAFAVTGVGEIRPGDDLGATLVAALADAGTPLLDRDVLVVSSKVVSKAEDRLVAGDSRAKAVEAETARIVAERMTPRGVARIVESRSGPVLAAAGVDSSNVELGTLLLLPADPDGSARLLRRQISRLTGRRVGVLVSDTAGRPWRDGQVDLAIGAAGVQVVDDLRGALDPHGQPLEVTVRALADELASLADLVKGKLAGTPAAVIRGLGTWVIDGDGPGAAALLRPARDDWFRFGHVEAVRAALGVPPGTDGVPAVDVAPSTVGQRLQRAVAVALVTASSASVEVGLEGDGGRFAVAGGSPGELVALGALVQRVVTAGWAEDLEIDVSPLELAPSPSVSIRARSRS